MKNWLMKNKRTLSIVAVAAISLLIFIAVLKSCSSHLNKHGEDGEPVLVRSLTLVESKVPEQVWASGTVTPVLKAELATKIMGSVADVYVKEGTPVKKGQLLIRLQASDLKAQVASSRAGVISAESMQGKAETAAKLQTVQTQANLVNAETALEMARQNLSMLQEGPRQEEKKQARLSLAQAEAQYKLAAAELKRMSRLYEREIIPKQRLEAVEAQHEVAKSQLEIARQMVEMSDKGGRKQQIQVASERVKQAEEAYRLAQAATVKNAMAEKEAQASAAMASQARAGEEMAEARFGYSEIRAPFSGVVTARSVDPGDMVSPGMPVVTVEDPSRFRLEVTVAARYIKEIHTGLKVPLELGMEKINGKGRVSLVAPACDAATRKFLVKVDIPPDLKPVSGDFGRAGFTVGHRPGLVVPEDALHEEGGIINVFVAGENKRSDMRIVRAGNKTGDGIEILTGLKANEKVIVWSAAPLHDDVPIEEE